MSKEAMKQALEALENTYSLRDDVIAAKEALRQAIAEAEKQAVKAELDRHAAALREQYLKQEPVAHINQNGVIHEAGYLWGPTNTITPLYTHQQPKREPLTDEQIWKIAATGNDGGDFGDLHWQDCTLDFVRAIEAAHGIKVEA